MGDWPRTDEFAASVIDLEAWAELEDPHSEIVGPLCLSFDVSPERRASISVCGLNASERFHVEVIEERKGTAWLPERIAELVQEHRPAQVICDGVGPPASMIPAIENLDVEVTTTTSNELGQACGRLVDAIAGGTVVHLGQDDLDSAVRAAGTRPLGDAWAWSRKEFEREHLAARFLHVGAVGCDDRGGEGVHVLMGLRETIARNWPWQVERSYPDPSYFTFNGNQYPYGVVQYPQPKGETEEIDASFVGYVQGAYKSNGVVAACMLARESLFSEARFQWRSFTAGRPGKLFGTEELAILEEPWPNGTTGDLLLRMEQDSSLDGSFYARRSRWIQRMRPDWVTILIDFGARAGSSDVVAGRRDHRLRLPSGRAELRCRGCADGTRGGLPVHAAP